ncbi:hypothetical protein EOL70_01835 [Leucothrix sargassi]|nr:hypothetical protein EOL70_01835 [Leucothrix sargassi]
MKLIKVFGVFLCLHIAAWGAAHVYLSSNKPEVLVVVDTSYAMKEKFAQVGGWIDDFESGSRYKRVVIGTDKALLGELAELKSKSVIFRAAFGRMTEESLSRYSGHTAKEKILLSDGSFQPSGWDLVSF